MGSGKERENKTRGRIGGEGRSVWIGERGWGQWVMAGGGGGEGGEEGEDKSLKGEGEKNQLEFFFLSFFEVSM